ncbi:glycosyltransferase family 2 protein [Agromyces badenianii]|uniref:Glycosyltransferase family 2 protein n=1 Tax=Agromyces badenianii TaxID=2080742 RepID=A0A2S0WYK6_9MICO|nr:glycosyltransferase family 2 protein [Agromyces badenianii]AWB96294.1 glycosyltransferase family 2 protein [Agromyces badenianii]
MTEPSIAICVVTYNSADLIEEFVGSLAAGAIGTDWHLVVADNASADGTIAELERWAPDATVVEVGENRGYAAGVNAAVRAAGPRDAYLIVNADVRLSAGCLAVLYARLSPEIGIAVPRLLDAEGELIWSLRREPTLARAWADALVGAERVGASPVFGEIVTDRRLYDAARSTDWAEGSTQLVSSACWAACGDWDESYFLYSEETEFDLRARDLGFATWYEPRATAIHLEGGSADSPRQWSLLVANRVRLFRARNGPAATAVFWLATVVRESTRTLLGKRASRAAIQDLLSPRRLRQTRSPEWLGGVRV